MSNYDSSKEVHELTSVSSTITPSSLIPCQDDVGNKLGVVTSPDIVKQTTLDDIQDGTSYKKITDVEKTNLLTHIVDFDNPHGVDKTDVGLGNVDNTADLDKAISTDTQAALDLKSDVGHDHDLDYEPKNANIQTHISTVTGNPHSVTKDEVGLGDVDNTADLDKPISTATQTALDGKADTAHTQAISTITDLQTTLDTKALKTNVLELDNVVIFTPDADYEPATKKYVDDATSGNLSVGSGVIVTGNSFGLEYARTGDNQVTFQPGNCMDSLNTTELALASAQAINLDTTANKQFFLFLCDDGVIREGSDVDGTGLEAYKIRFRGWWKNNASGVLCVGSIKKGLMVLGKASEWNLGALSTSYAIIDHTAYIPESRVIGIGYGMRDAGGTTGIAMSSLNGTDAESIIGFADGATDDTGLSAWGYYTHTNYMELPYNSARLFKMFTNQGALAIHSIRLDF